MTFTKNKTLELYQNDTDSFDLTLSFHFRTFLLKITCDFVYVNPTVKSKQFQAAVKSKQFQAVKNVRYMIDSPC